MKRLGEIAVLCSVLLSLTCTKVTKADTSAMFVEITRHDSLGLVAYYPQFSRIDLVCGTMPSPVDPSVILVAEAAYTGELLDTFAHSNIAGDHVSGGTLHRGYHCKRNTGAFVYYGGNEWAFTYPVDPDSMAAAARSGGAAFGQEMIINRGQLTPIAREDDNHNIFRALCEVSGRLCVVESVEAVDFGVFRRSLLRLGAAEAIYMDMGSGWNHAWCRPTADSILTLHPHTHDYCTNWITFYR